jgi:hypothetical protein
MYKNGMAGKEERENREKQGLFLDSSRQFLYSFFIINGPLTKGKTGDK